MDADAAAGPPNQVSGAVRRRLAVAVGYATVVVLTASAAVINDQGRMQGGWRSSCWCRVSRPWPLLRSDRWTVGG